MRARIPAGIDLEDRLLYGLSPARLGYVAGLLVLAIWCWRQALPAPVRALPAVALVVGAAAIGWLRHEGRHLDSWAEDAARHLVGRYRVEVDLHPLSAGLSFRGRPADRPKPEVAEVVQEAPASDVSFLLLCSNGPP